MTEEPTQGAESRSKKPEKVQWDDDVPVQNFTDIIRVVARRSKAGFDKVHEEINKLYNDSGDKATTLNTSPDYKPKAKFKWWASSPKSPMWVSTGSIQESSFVSYIADESRGPGDDKNADPEQYSELGNKIRGFKSTPNGANNASKLNQIAHGSVLVPPSSAENVSPGKSEKNLLSTEKQKPKKTVFNFEGIPNCFDEDISSDVANALHNKGGLQSLGEDDIYQVPSTQIRPVLKQERKDKKLPLRPSSELISSRRKYVRDSSGQSNNYNQFGKGNTFGRIPLRSTLNVTNEDIIYDVPPAKPFPKGEPDYDVPIAAEIKAKKEPKQSKSPMKSNLKPVNEEVDYDEIPNRMETPENALDYVNISTKPAIVESQSDDIYDVPKPLHHYPGIKNAKHDRVPLKPISKIARTKLQHNESPCSSSTSAGLSETIASVNVVANEEIEYDEIPHTLDLPQDDDPDYVNVYEKPPEKKKNQNVIKSEGQCCATRINFENGPIPKNTSAGNIPGQPKGGDDSDEDYLRMDGAVDDYVNVSAFAKHKLNEVDSDSSEYMTPDVNVLKKNAVHFP